VGPAAFLEIKINTDALHFLQELLRLSEALRQRSPLQIDRVWVCAEGWFFQIEQRRETQPDINELTRAHLEVPAQADSSTWSLLFNTLQNEARVKELVSLELRMIGGSHPLLVRLTGCSSELYALLSELLERCGALWDAQVVGHTNGDSLLWDFFQRVDVRRHPWLRQLERVYFGDAFDHFAPSVERTERERPTPTAQDTVPNAAAAPPAQPATTQPPQDQDTVPKGAEASPAQPALANSPTPSTQQPESNTPRRMYGPTEEKVAMVRQLLAEKRQGRHRARAWLWACREAGIDLKTARKHLAAERAEWDTLTARQSGRSHDG
jgi:cell division septation protein DedD